MPKYILASYFRARDKAKFADIIRSCRLSRALVPAKGALWRDEISCMLVKRPKFEELYLRIYCVRTHIKYRNSIAVFNRDSLIRCLSEENISHIQTQNIQSDIFFSGITLGLLLFYGIFLHFYVFYILLPFFLSIP